MTNEEILQKLEEEILLRGFSPHTLEEYMIRAKTFMLYAKRPLEELTEQDIRADSLRDNRRFNRCQKFKIS